ncbi:glutamate receptor ionotropic, delta-1 [Nephila pilipes]|uniref:Glutamate receptor ionotropic, delta-1 n=1 Tax=Nephila pilipes TaxID=299642 RepID=A0A8X6JCB4_NEPPI|nr:glutamate receptor ionotropic, delta-1 [Nephila pilipes]
MVISFSYSATLLSFFIQPSKPNYIRTLSEFSTAVQRCTHKAVIAKFCNPFFLNSGIDHLVWLGEIILQNNWFMEFSKVHSEAYINPHSCQGINRNIAKVLFADRDDVYISKESMYVTPLAFAHSKRFCCVSKLNWILSNFASAGVYEKMLRLSAMKMSLKHPRKPRDSKVVLPLSLIHLFRAFIVFARDLIISIISFLGEIVHCKKHFNSTTKQTFSLKGKRN